MNNIKTHLQKLLYLASLLISSAIGIPISKVFADAEINIRDEAVNNDLPGTENATATDGGLGYWIGRSINVVMVFSALLLFINLITGGIEWVSSGGDSGKLQKARDRIFQSIIGILVLSATIALFVLVQNFLDIEVLNFTTPTPP